VLRSDRSNSSALPPLALQESSWVGVGSRESRRDTDLYAQILEVASPWQVKDVELRLSAGEVGGGAAGSPPARRCAAARISDTCKTQRFSAPAPYRGEVVGWGVGVGRPGEPGQSRPLPARFVVTDGTAGGMNPAATLDSSGTGCRRESRRSREARRPLSHPPSPGCAAGSSRAGGGERGCLG
jgi:hypothetical protein